MSWQAEVLRQLDAIPDGSLVPIAAVRAMLIAADGPEVSQSNEHERPTPLDSIDSWRAKLWTVPPEARLGVEELSEAIGKRKSWIYRHTSQKSGLELLPHRRLDGALVFIAGEIRAWLEAHERVVVMPPSEEITPIVRARSAGKRSGHVAHG